MPREASSAIAEDNYRVTVRGWNMVFNAISEWNKKRTLRQMLHDPRATRGFRSIAQLEKSIGGDRATTERLLLAIGARKSTDTDEWTLTTA